MINPTSIIPLPPNAQIEPSEGQSIYGRTSDYKCSARDNERPLLSGEIELLGDNILDSIRVNNQLVHVDLGSQTIESQ